MDIPSNLPKVQILQKNLQKITTRRIFTGFALNILSFYIGATNGISQEVRCLLYIYIHCHNNYF